MFLELTRESTGTKLLINMDTVVAVLGTENGTILYYEGEADDVVKDSYESIRMRLAPRVVESEA